MASELLNNCVVVLHKEQIEEKNSENDNTLAAVSRENSSGLESPNSINEENNKINESFVTAIDKLSDGSIESDQNLKINGNSAANNISMGLEQKIPAPVEDLANRITKISVVQDPVTPTNTPVQTPRQRYSVASPQRDSSRSSRTRQINVNVLSGHSSSSSSRGLRHASTADVQTIGKYRLLKTIGKGNFARVKLALHIPTSRHVAIKMIDKTQLNASGLQKLFREVKIMKILNHPNIVKLYEVIETERILYLVMEYASKGEIFDFLVTNGRMKEKEVRCKFRQILSAMQYCHRKKIVHRDLKAENLLLDSDFNIKLGDFGFSNEFNPGSLLDTFCGSPPYAAPELFQGKKYEGPEVDVWSLGVILYTMVSGSLPFDGRNLRELREKIIKGKYRVPFYMTSDCENLLKKFLIINPKKRSSLEAAMKDAWLNVGHELDRLEPYVEPTVTVDETRIDSMIKMGYKEADIRDAVLQNKYNDVAATYHLLGVKQAVIDDTKSSSSRLSASQRSRPVVVSPPKSSTTTNDRTSFSAGTPVRPRISRNISMNVPSTSSATRGASVSRAYPIRVVQTPTTPSIEDRRGSGATNGAINKNSIMQKLGPSRLSQREPNKSAYKDPRVVRSPSTNSRMKSCTSMESSTDAAGTNLLSCFPERHHRGPGNSLANHQDSSTLYPCNTDEKYVIGSDKPRDILATDEADLADGVLTVKAIRSTQKSPPSSPIEADLADPTSPWSSAAHATAFNRRASDGRTNMMILSSRPPPLSTPQTSSQSRPLSRQKIGRSTVHGPNNPPASNVVLRQAQPNSASRGARLSIDSQTPIGVQGQSVPADGRRFSLFTRITARFNKK